jgi:hypothetical protein
VSDGERPEDKKNRISFVLVLFALIGAVGYLNHGRMREFGGSGDSYLWKLGILAVIACLVSIYVWWANRRDFK